MITSSIDLKKKIEIFKIKFNSKTLQHKFEKNAFDLLVDRMLKNIDSIIKLLLRNIFMRSFKILDQLITRLNNQSTLEKKLKSQILNQREIIDKSLELNNELSKKIENLNKKIDNLISNKELKLINADNEQSNSQNVSIKIPNLEKNTEIAFFQKENLRLSNELYDANKKFEIMKEEIQKFQNQRSNLIEKVNSINDVITDSNVMKNVFDNHLTNATIKILDHNKKTINNNSSLNDKVKEIFGKN